MRVLVTGGSGFVGRNLCEALNTRDYWAPTSKEVDLMEYEGIHKAIVSYRPEVIVHLAGMVGGILANKMRKGDFFIKNSVPGINLLHAVKETSYKRPRVISLAAGCGYPINAPVPLKEDNFFDGLPQEDSLSYSMAKKNLILQGWAYKEQFGLQSTVLLPANLYGPYDNFDLESSHVVPALVRKFVEAKVNGSNRIDLWGSGSASREFLYVGDVVDAINKAIDNDTLDVGPYNLGTGIETTIKELADNLTSITDYKGLLFWNSDMPEGSPRRMYDMSRFKDAFGYVPNTSLKEGLTKTIKWYKEKSI